MFGAYAVEWMLSFLAITEKDGSIREICWCIEESATLERGIVVGSGWK